MCAVSNMGDMGRTLWPNPWPNHWPPGNPAITPAQPYQPGMIPAGPAPWEPRPGQTFTPPPYNGPTKEQFEEFLKLLRAAKRFDTLLGMKDCEMAEKLEWLKAIASYLGADVKDLAP